MTMKISINKKNGGELNMKKPVQYNVSAREFQNE